MKRDLLLAAIFAMFVAPAIGVPNSLDELDARIRELRSEPLATAMSGYAEIITETQTAPDHVAAFRTACRALSRRVFREECADYGYSCPAPGADIWRWPAVIDKSAISVLRQNVPVLNKCPDIFLLELPLPWFRIPIQVDCEMVENDAYGWVIVSLTLDEKGSVATASVSESTSELLNSSALEAARGLKYVRHIGQSGYVSEEQIPAVIYFDRPYIQSSDVCEQEEGAR